MAKIDLPGAFEQLVLLAVARLGDGAYGMTVRREIEERTGRPTSLGAVYSTLERLENKGYVASAPAQGGAERAGRPRSIVNVTTQGHKVLRQTLDALDRLRGNVTGIQPAEVRR